MAQSPRGSAGLTSAAYWHARYLQQTSWTASTRRYLYRLAGLSTTSRVLEAGCGTGAVLSDCPAGGLHGVDWDFAALRLARTTVPHVRLICADALSLPYPTAVFDACLTHFFLLWVDAPRALAEMRRVTRPGGAILALAEPDYGARIDWPAELAEPGRLQALALQDQGADPLTGRKLGQLFVQAGLQQVTSGVIGGEWGAHALDEAWEQEWATLESDLEGRLTQQQLNELRNLDAAAWQHGERVLFVPTFYAIGRVP